MTLKNPKDSDNKPSEMFINSLFGYGIGSDELECGWCGRTHLCPDTDYSQYDEDGCYTEDSKSRYKEYCEQLLKDNPDTVVLHHNCDGISSFEMNGIMFVLGCPCNGLYRYEHFIWSHRDTIRNYLKVRVEREREWAEQELTKNKLAGISE